MTITPHILAGSAIAVATTKSLPVAFLIGFVTHFIIDAIPHIDPGTFFWSDDLTKKRNEPWPAWIYIFAVLEFIIIWTLVIILFKNKPDFGIIMMGALGSITLDVLDNNPLRFLRQKPFFRQLHWIHEKFHYDLPAARWYWGVPSQIIIIGGSLWYLLKF